MWKSAGAISCIAFAFILANGCAREAKIGKSTGMDMPTSAFQSQFELLDTVVLEQPDSLPIVRISGLDRASDGRWVLSDPSEGMVKIFAPDGRLLQVIARKGRGPKEFQLPELAQFGASNTVHVVDNMLQRISVFDASGRLLRHVPLRRFMRITDFAALQDGTYLLAGFRLGGDKNVLFRTDSVGELIASYLPISDYIPPDETDSQAWRLVRRPSFTLQGSTATVVLSISDSVWTVDLARGQVRAERVAPPGYLSPYPANPSDLKGVKDIEKWVKSFSTTAEVFGEEGTLIVPFVRGLLNEGDPTTLAMRVPGGQWRALSGSPPLLRSRGNELIAIHRPGADQITLAVYRRRS